ncbi:hypothetical protein LCGC14_1326410, partial [marine sediment metagenome]
VSSLVDGTITGTSPNEVSLGQTGIVTFSSTESVAKQQVINGVLGFYFKVEIIGVVDTTRISNVAVVEPFQPIQDFWDGEVRTTNSVQLFEDGINKDNTINVFEDSFIFDDATEGNTATYMDMNELTATTEYLQLGFTERIQGLQIKMIPNKSNGSTSAIGKVILKQSVIGIADSMTGITVDGVQIMSGTEIGGVISSSEFAERVAANINKHISVPNYTAEGEGNAINIISALKGTAANGLTVTGAVSGFTITNVNTAGAINITSALTVNYWSGSAWVTVGTVTDGTIDNSASFGKSGFITWNPITENTEFKREIGKEEKLHYYKLVWNSAFSPDVLSYFIAGIPVQKQIDSYKFPLHAQGRLWLFSNKDGDKNEAIVTNINELNSFNGKGVGDPFKFGDKTEIVAAVELFTKKTISVDSLILVLKESSGHIIEGDNPENWKVINLDDNIGCNAPYTLSVSTLGLEVAPLQRKSIAIWQGSSGIYMFDNSAIHTVSDDISNFFDQRNSDAINLAKVGLSYGFFEVENGEHYYHWCFASGSSTTLDKEWVLDIKRQKWFEADRGTAKALQGGGMVLDTSGNVYNYGFIDTGFIERLNNGTTYDGNTIDYEMDLGDQLPSGDINILTSMDYVRLATVSKTNTSSTIKVEHFGDTKTVATTDNSNGNAFYTFKTNKTGQRICMPSQRINTPPHMMHRLKFTISTDNETVGFEPLFVSGFYKLRGESELSITD